MQLISRTKVLYGLGAVALALTVPVAASAAPAELPVPSVTQHTQGCEYVVNANHIHMYKTPGGTPNRTVLQKGFVVFSAPRTVVGGPHGTQWAFVIDARFPVAPVGFVNKAFLTTKSCRTPANS